MAEFQTLRWKAWESRVARGAAGPSALRPPPISAPRPLPGGPVGPILLFDKWEAETSRLWLGHTVTVYGQVPSSLRASVSPSDKVGNGLRMPEGPSTAREGQHLYPEGPGGSSLHPLGRPLTAGPLTAPLSSPPEAKVLSPGHRTRDNGPHLPRAGFRRPWGGKGVHLFINSTKADEGVEGRDLNLGSRIRLSWFKS